MDGLTVEVLAKILREALTEEFDSHGAVYLELDTLTSVENGNKTATDQKVLRVLGEVIRNIKLVEGVSK
jgi:hypothetical protein